MRVLIAKDAISTGWDCPRAEVLVSFRPAQDNTHITQLLGRMVRSPLARRDPRRRAAERRRLHPAVLRPHDGSEGRPLPHRRPRRRCPAERRRWCSTARSSRPNPNVPDAVWELWEALPTQTLPAAWRPAGQASRCPRSGAVGRQVRDGALKEVEEELHRILDGSYDHYLEGSSRDAVQERVGRAPSGDRRARSGDPKLTYDRVRRARRTTARSAPGSRPPRKHSVRTSPRRT